jgi:hypothetical protein
MTIERPSDSPFECEGCGSWWITIHKFKDNPGLGRDFFIYYHFYIVYIYRYGSKIRNGFSIQR